MKTFLSQLVLGLVICIFLPSFFWQDGSSDKITLLSSILLVFSTILTKSFLYRFPGITSTTYISPIFLFWFLLILLVVKISGLPYSLLSYTVSAIILFIYLFVINTITHRYEKYIFAYIPIGRTIDLPNQISFVKWVSLSKPVLTEDVKGIVTDLYSNDLDDNWEKFIAEKTLQGIPVYHYRHIRESLTGRVRINHISENELGSLLPSENYIFLKRLIDSILIISTFPITIPVMLVTALLIKIESPGKILFTQKRVGQGGKEFIIYKFRSMRSDSESQGAKMATIGDMRITKIGKFIRKTRIDELPQFFNVLKGDMSLIGPRPEQKIFVEQFEKTIPFYNYRHIVKPGITGWAQVTQGYVGDEDETKIKVEYDFYYIKHFSFSLDLLIFFKTIYTMLTGYGAR